METVLTIVHVVVAFFMIVVVLLQAGKGSGMGALGGGASQTAFGASSGLSFLGKLTTAAAIIFMITSMSLAYLSSNTSSIVDDVLDQPAAATPAIAPAEKADEKTEDVKEEPVKAAEPAKAVEEKQEEPKAEETKAE